MRGVVIALLIGLIAGRALAQVTTANVRGVVISGDDGTPMAERPRTDQSTKRIASETGREMPGGNGLTGHDETSERTDLTWDTSFSAATPGSVPSF